MDNRECVFYEITAGGKLPTDLKEEYPDIYNHLYEDSDKLDVGDYIVVEENSQIPMILHHSEMAFRYIDTILKEDEIINKKVIHDLVDPLGWFSISMFFFNETMDRNNTIVHFTKDAKGIFLQHGNS